MTVFCLLIAEWSGAEVGSFKWPSLMGTFGKLDSMQVSGLQLGEERGVLVTGSRQASS
jgi:hypothetical protein